MDNKDSNNLDLIMQISDDVMRYANANSVIQGKMQYLAKDPHQQRSCS